MSTRVFNHTQTHTHTHTHQNLTRHNPNLNQNPNQNRNGNQKHKQPAISRQTVGVYLPNKPYREGWRLLRTYARELRDMNLGRFVNRADDFRLFFTPDPRKAFPRAAPLPGESLGLDQRRLENGISLRPARRTGVRCLRIAEHRPTQCRDNNHVPKSA